MLERGKAINALARFYESLAYAIQHPDSIPVGQHPYPYARATKVEPVKMFADEADAWNRTFDIAGKVLAARKEIAAIETDIPLAELDKVTYENVMKAAMSRHTPWQEISGSVLYGGKYSKFFPFEVDGMELYVQPRAIFEKMPDGSGIWTASVQLRFFVKDKEGRLAVGVPTPINHGFPAYRQDAISPGAIVAPYEPIDADVYFNTVLDPIRQNELLLDIITPNRIRMRAEIHDGEKITKMQIPDNGRVEVFFWQVDRFLAPIRNGCKTIDDLFRTEDRVR